MVSKERLKDRIFLSLKKDAYSEFRKKIEKIYFDNVMYFSKDVNYSLKHFSVAQVIEWYCQWCLIENKIFFVSDEQGKEDYMRTSFFLKPGLKDGFNELCDKNEITMSKAIMFFINWVNEIDEAKFIDEFEKNKNKRK